MSGLVGNTEDRFSRGTAQMKIWSSSSTITEKKKKKEKKKSNLVVIVQLVCELC